MNEVNSAGNLISFWEYNGIVKEAIKQIKYKGVYDIVRELINKKYFEIADNTIITYIPMHIKKKKKRGFNQAEIIAREVGRKMGVPVAKLLEKIKPTRGQAKLSKEERLENLKNCFSIVGADLCVSPQMPNVLLVDDVYTTGATMAECAKVLCKAGFENINYFTLARAV